MNDLSLYKVPNTQSADIEITIKEMADSDKHDLILTTDGLVLQTKDTASSYFTILQKIKRRQPKHYMVS